MDGCNLKCSKSAVFSCKKEKRRKNTNTQTKWRQEVSFFSLVISPYLKRILCHFAYLSLSKKDKKKRRRKSIRWSSPTPHKSSHFRIFLILKQTSFFSGDVIVFLTDVTSYRLRIRDPAGRWSCVRIWLTAGCGEMYTPRIYFPLFFGW